MLKLNFLKLEYNLKDQKKVNFKEQKWYSKFAAIFLNAFVITPLVIIYWASIWSIM